MSGLVWSASAFEDVLPPATAIAMLQQAIAAQPDAAAPYEKLGNAYLDLHDFERAAACFEAAFERNPSSIATRIRLARALNVIGRAAEAFGVAREGAVDDPVLRAVLRVQVGIALQGLGRVGEAEIAFREALRDDPNDRMALFRLCRDLRGAGRNADCLALCEELVAAGAQNAQLWLSWGRALALNGDIAKARALLFDPARVCIMRLNLPSGFNQALADELLTNPVRISKFPDGEQANRGSHRVHHLMCGAHPERVRAVMTAINGAVDSLVSSLEPAVFDPWARSAPTAAHLHAWGLIQRGSDYEAWHTHRGGWLSGVYYVRIPKGLSAEHGCIEFGPPPSLAAGFGNAVTTRRYPPEEGMLLLAPSHYHHRTIPSGLDEWRVSFAFDVVPDDKPAIP